MGMYTGLKVRVLIKEEARPIIALLNEVCDWREVAQKYPEVGAWAAVGRANFIPFGCLSYMPDDFPDHMCEFKDGWWEFSCSLKNYEGEIKQFVEFIRPMIERVEEFWSLYEEYPPHKDCIDTFEHWGKFRTHHLQELTLK